MNSVELTEGLIEINEMLDEFLYNNFKIANNEYSFEGINNLYYDYADNDLIEYDTIRELQFMKLKELISDLEIFNDLEDLKDKLNELLNEYDDGLYITQKQQNINLIEDFIECLESLININDDDDSILDIIDDYNSVFDLLNCHKEKLVKKFKLPTSNFKLNKDKENWIIEHLSKL